MRIKNAMRWGLKKHKKNTGNVPTMKHGAEPKPKQETRRSRACVLLVAWGVGVGSPLASLGFA
jgi:hypothetical protein